MKLWSSEQIVVAGILQDFCLRPLAKGATTTQSFRQFLPLPWPCAQPELRLGLQGTHPVRCDVHFVLNPCWHRAPRQLSIGKLVRLFGKLVGESQSKLDLRAQRLVRIEPTAPAVITKHRPAHASGVLARESSFSSQHVPQNLVRGMIAASGPNDALGQGQKEPSHRSAELQLCAVTI